MSADRNLLFGVLAFQAGLIDAQQFASGCNLWSANKAIPLSQVLLEQGWLTAQDCDHLAYLLDRHLSKHQGDETISLQAAADARILRILQNLKDPDIERSLANLTRDQDYLLLSTRENEPENRERYTLTRLHAEGGIGQVWVAQDANLSREVALKELKPERAGLPEQWNRFLEEACLTSQLQHPGIVPVYELARRTDNQQPFYTMRLVQGRTLRTAIKEYHERRLKGESGPLEGRALIEAFVGVCHAVAYAHSRGVIHRDLKPQNVVLGGFGEVIVLDWGLAKVVDQPSDELETPPVVAGNLGQREETIEGQVVGTPAYMAPEQAAGRVDLINRSSDVYGLGAILYQILTDKPPFTGASVSEVLERVRSIAPPAPRALAPEVPRALEAVCLKALAKYPEHRYPSALALGLEIKRWLADEPVLAYREPALARAARWARRHRTWVASAAVLLVTLVGSLGVGLVLVKQEQSRTEAKRREADAVNDFLNTDLLAQADPRRSPDKDLKMRTVLDRAREKIDGRFAGQPLVEARIRNTLGTAYLGLGEYAIAEKLLRDARALYETRLPLDDRTRLRSSADLAFALYRMGSAEAVALLNETLENQQRVVGADEPDTLRTLIVLGHVNDDRGRHDEASKIYEKVLAAQKRMLGETHPATLMTLIDLGVNLNRRGRSGEARKLLEETLGTQKRALKPSDQLDIQASMNNLASVLESMGLDGDALSLLRELLTLQQKSLPPDHPDILNTRMSVAFALLHLQDFTAALKEFEDTIALQKRVLGPQFHRTLISMRGYANTLGKLGHYELARKSFDETLASQLRALSPSDPEVLTTKLDLASMLEEMGQSEESLKLKQEILAVRNSEKNTSPHDRFEVMRQTALSLSSLGRNREAGQMLEDTWNIARRNFQPGDEDWINGINGLAWFLATVDDKELRDSRRAVKLSKELADLRPELGACWNSYGVALYRDGDWKGAVDSLTKSVTLSKSGDSNDFFFLAMATWQLGQHEAARQWFDKAVQWMDKNQPKNPELVRFRAEAQGLLGIKK
jgi:tetratricopeptide (TPR) repeat protein